MLYFLNQEKLNRCITDTQHMSSTYKFSVKFNCLIKLDKNIVRNFWYKFLSDISFNFTIDWISELYWNN